ncbi:spore gernimation protein GerPD [Paenibacillus hexagrammi]|uniref:Spore gernimation protein GerPD n=1 Tax=Paenibacillus hexagrammi TaxID=2908839 RepID=A0ABY3SHB1_9BACL|nr:spore gernimation protein GerPD [Paenibacillus sp. YPD9-1]UJF32893.1 spore gernimation protein GerPD [Paenibacillus sp. YPD9-1]
MIFQVENKELCVGNVRIVGVASSSMFLIGDTVNITLSSMFDTPPESVIISPFVPLAGEQ